MRDESKPLLKGRFKVYVCPHVRFDCYSKTIQRDETFLQSALLTQCSEF